LVKYFKKKIEYTSSLSLNGYNSYPNHNDIHDHETDFHQCKIAMVNVLEDGVLSEKLAEEVLSLTTQVKTEIHSKK
jgi:hypothetical protein